MILQGMYRFASQVGPDVRMEGAEYRVVMMTVKDWREMGSPNEVSVTIMPTLLYTKQYTEQQRLIAAAKKEEEE